MNHRYSISYDISQSYPLEIKAASSGSIYDHYKYFLDDGTLFIEFKRAHEDFEKKLKEIERKALEKYLEYENDKT